MTVSRLGAVGTDSYWSTESNDYSVPCKPQQKILIVLINSSQLLQWKCLEDLSRNELIHF